MGWTKLFLSGDTISEPQSWSKTNLNGMNGAELIVENVSVAIYGVGQYWQSDTYEVDINYGSHYPRLTKRRILKYIENIQVGIINNQLPLRYEVRFDSQVDNKKGQFVMINKFPIWYVLEIDIKENKVNNYYLENKI